jgi:hypothetical protein
MPYNSAQDQYPGSSRSVEGQARTAVAVTPSDTTDLPTYAKALYIGTSGDIAVIPVGSPTDTSVIFSGHPTGYFRVQVRRVLSTGTTAGNIVALGD